MLCFDLEVRQVFSEKASGTLRNDSCYRIVGWDENPQALSLIQETPKHTIPLNYHPVIAKNARCSEAIPKKRSHANLIGDCFAARQRLAMTVVAVIP
jgi:hypothetical protein